MVTHKRAQGPIKLTYHLTNDEGLLNNSSLLKLGIYISADYWDPQIICYLLIFNVFANTSEELINSKCL